MNIVKYFTLLENLKFQHALTKPESTDPIFISPASILQTNLEIIEKFEKADLNRQLQDLYSLYKLAPDQAKSIVFKRNPHYSYIVRLSHILHIIISNTNFDSDAKEDLISVAHLRLCIQAVQELSYYALRCQLADDFLQINIFRDAQKMSPNRELLWLSVQLFRRLMEIRQFHIAHSMQFVHRDLLAAILSLDEAQPNLDMANINKADFVVLLLLLVGCPQLKEHRRKILHQALIRQLHSPYGFASFVEALKKEPQNVLPSTVLAETVANMLVRGGFTQGNQRMKIYELFDFCSTQLKEGLEDLEVGILSLRRLYDLNNANQLTIKKKLAKHWEILISPECVLTGTILLEHDELCHHITLFYEIFCNSFVACLPSNLLIDYLPFLLHVYDGLPMELDKRKQLSALIIRCLDNREKCSELADLLKKLLNLTENKDTNFVSLHPRILLVPLMESSKMVAKMGPPTDQARRNLIKILGEILLADSNHSLTCNVFLALLSHLGDLLKEETSSSIDFISTENELNAFLYAKYNSKLELLLLLNQMVAHHPLRTQISLQSKEFIKLIEKLLQQRLERKLFKEKEDSTDQILLLILSLLQEVLQRSENLLVTGNFNQLQNQLEQLKMKSTNQLIKETVDTLLSQLQGVWSPSEALKADAFNKARSLIQQKQSHLQVYGIQLMLKLLQQKDTTTMAKGHMIIALALTTLNDKESYTFLNCVRLFVTLTHTMEAEVMEKLSDEYLSESSDLDYRLVVGEAILKSAQELGPLCYRYKAELLNAFMLGCRSDIPEFRMSSFANLALLCRILGYQVHNFFQELLQLINAELTQSVGYIPSKRAAVLVLAELLNGMGNLFDYQEMLLPIYRLLKAIESDESTDPQMRQHAANGLKILNEKCRDLIKSVMEEQSLVKEIKILGINPSSKCGKKSILELN